MISQKNDGCNRLEILTHAGAVLQPLRRGHHVYLMQRSEASTYYYQEERYNYSYDYIV